MLVELCDVLLMLTMMLMAKRMWHFIVKSDQHLYHGVGLEAFFVVYRHGAEVVRTLDGHDGKWCGEASWVVRSRVVSSGESGESGERNKQGVV